MPSGPPCVTLHKLGDQAGLYVTGARLGPRLDFPLRFERATAAQTSNRTPTRLVCYLPAVAEPLEARVGGRTLYVTGSRLSRPHDATAVSLRQ